MTMATFFWMTNTADNDCGYEGVLEDKMYNTRELVVARNYFLGKGGELGDWLIKYEKEPCDISRTPIQPLFSEKFKNLTENIGIQVRFHKARVEVQGKESSSSYYFAEPLVTPNILNTASDGVIFTDSDSRDPGWIRDYSYKSSFHLDRIDEGVHWIKEPNTYGKIWIVSEFFKSSIEEAGLNNFNFLEAIPSR